MEPSPLTSRKRSSLFATVLFLFLLVGLIVGNLWIDIWWPGVMLLIGLPLALRQYLLGRTYDMGMTLLVFVGTFITVEFDIAWKIFLPTLFTLGALYIFVRELLESAGETVEEEEEDINHEIEEKK